MARYLAKRLLAAAAALLIILTLAFCVVRLMPGSVYDDPNLPSSAVALLESRAGLDKPLFVQYILFLKGIISENFWGISLKVEPGVPVFDVLAKRIPVSFSLNLIALIVSLPAGMAAGVLYAVKKDKAVSAAVSVGTIMCVSVPSFVFASVLQYILAYKLKIFPILYEPSAAIGLRLRSVILPVAALAAGPVATVARYLGRELTEANNTDYVLLARSKGLSNSQTVTKHTLRNSVLPVFNVITPMFAQILGGSMVVEQLFSIPGAGGILIKSINARDHSLTVAALVFYAAVSAVVTLISDIAYGAIDPRVRVWSRKHE